MMMMSGIADSENSAWTCVASGRNQRSSSPDDPKTNYTRLTTILILINLCIETSISFINCPRVVSATTVPTQQSSSLFDTYPQHPQIFIRLTVAVTLSSQRFCWSHARSFCCWYQNNKTLLGVPIFNNRFNSVTFGFEPDLLRSISLLFRASDDRSIGIPGRFVTNTTTYWHYGVIILGTYDRVHNILS